MEALRNEITLGLVTVYLCACIAIGFWAMRQTRSSRDFFVAGRQLGTWVTSIAVFSTTLSGFGFVGGPGMVYSMGITSVWLIVTSVTGYVLTFVLLAKRDDAGNWVMEKRLEGDLRGVKHVLVARRRSRRPWPIRPRRSRCCKCRRPHR